MKKKISELKGKSKDELEKEVQALREEISKLKLEFKVNPGKDTNILAKKRKKLAVILTLIGEKKEIEKINPDEL